MLNFKSSLKALGAASLLGLSAMTIAAPASAQSLAVVVDPPGGSPLKIGKSDYFVVHRVIGEDFCAPFWSKLLPPAPHVPVLV